MQLGFSFGSSQSETRVVRKLRIRIDAGGGFSNLEPDRCRQFTDVGSASRRQGALSTSSLAFRAFWAILSVTHDSRPTDSAAAPLLRNPHPLPDHAVRFSPNMQAEGRAGER